MKTWIELVSEEVREGLEGTPFADARLFPSPHELGRLDELKNVLADQAQKLRSTQRGSRPPSHRSRFHHQGAGTVVTGTLWQGSVVPRHGA